VIWQYHSGRPYTFYPSQDGITPLNPEMLFLPNNRRMPSYHLADLRVGKSHCFGSAAATSGKGGLKTELYLKVNNLFNDRNVRWIDACGRIGGELSDPSAWEIGRRSAIGFRAEW